MKVSPEVLFSIDDIDGLLFKIGLKLVQDENPLC